MKNGILISIISLIFFTSCESSGKLTEYVNPLLGSATLWDKKDLGYERHKKTRTWGAETYPGATLPNAMVQVSPVTQYRSGAGYQYEDSVIYGFSHTNKGHWNLLHVPMMPVVGNVSPSNYCSSFSHQRETAHPGYYQVYLDRYKVNVELTSTLRCAYHKYTFREEDDKSVLVDIRRSNNAVTDWHIEKSGDKVFTGYQAGEGKIYFYATTNYAIKDVAMLKDDKHEVALVNFVNSKGKKPLELKIGFSFVSIENAKMNLEYEMLHKDFAQVAREADHTWEKLLSKIRVSGGTEREKRLFYSCLYHSFKWPALRSDVNFEYTDIKGNVVNNGFNYYTNPSFWDDYRNKLVLLEMLSPEVTTDVIKSIIDKGEKSNGYMPTFFHGDHASTFISGSWLRGLHNFDLKRAYKLILKNATVPGKGGRPYLDEYIKRGWIAEKDTVNVPTQDEYKGAVTKTVEYAYDDYAVALVAKELGDQKNYDMLMKRTKNYKTLFDPSTGFWRGKIEDGSWIADFDPYYPYYQYMYREANAWNALFFAPHDPEGMIKLYPNNKAVEAKLDSLFTEPWRGYEVDNMTGFIGNYCHGNQPGHSIPYTYYFIGKQEKTQAILDLLMEHYYDMGKDKLAYAGMDDAGEMSSWYVFNAIGLYTYSPADPNYIITVPLFDKVKFYLNDKPFTIVKQGKGRKIREITYDNKVINGYFISHEQLQKGKKLVITVE